MKLLISLASGLAGAVALTLLHQAMKANLEDAPRMDKLGRQALKKAITATGADLPSRRSLQRITLAGDIAGNALFYSLAGLAPGKSVAAGSALGLMAGAGAVLLPEPLGLHTSYAHKTTRTTLLTIGLYWAGGTLAGAVQKALLTCRKG